MTSESRLASLFLLNRPRFIAAGWTLRSVLTMPTLAMRTVLFPPVPPAWAVDAPPLPLLPQQQAAQVREDQMRWRARLSPDRDDTARAQFEDFDWVAAPLLPRTRATKTSRPHRPHRTSPRPLELRNGAFFEPLAHHAYGPRRHYAPRPGQEA